MPTDRHAAIRAFRELNLPIDPLLKDLTELRYAEDLPGMGGLYHPVPIVEDGVDRPEIRCRRVFEDSSRAISPVSSAEFVELLDAGKVCSPCVNTLTTLNMEYMVMGDDLVLRSHNLAQEVQGLLEKTKDPDQKFAPSFLGAVYSNRRRFAHKVDGMRSHPGFEVFASQIDANLVALNEAVDALIEVFRQPQYADEFAEVLAAIDSSRAAQAEKNEASQED